MVSPSSPTATPCPSPKCPPIRPNSSTPSRTTPPIHATPQRHAPPPLRLPAPRPRHRKRWRAARMSRVGVPCATIASAPHAGSRFPTVSPRPAPHGSATAGEYASGAGRSVRLPFDKLRDSELVELHAEVLPPRPGSGSGKGKAAAASGAAAAAGQRPPSRPSASNRARTFDILSCSAYTEGALGTPSDHLGAMLAVRREKLRAFVRVKRSS